MNDKRRRPHRITRAQSHLKHTVCRFCLRNPWAADVDGCVEFLIRDGRPRVPLTWPPDLDIPDDNPCECGAMPGRLHHYQCGLELCPFADDHPDDGEQLLFCGCHALEDPDLSGG